MQTDFDTRCDKAQDELEQSLKPLLKEWGNKWQDSGLKPIDLKAIFESIAINSFRTGM